MMTAGNSPLENPKLSWDDMIKGKKPFETPEQRKIRFEKLIKKIEESEADASIARGYASLDVTATTSGQVTDLKLPNSQEEIYTSWIGDALGIGVQGGFSILFSNKEILLDIFEGWKLYRTSLNETTMLKGNQINTWNGQWLSHYYDTREYDADMPLAGYNPFKFNDGKKMKHWLVMPEVRYWTCEKFNGTFIGVHALGGQYNIAGIKLPFGIFPNLKDHRYDGYLYGGGLTLGHQWILNKRWSIEAAIGAGYARVHYDKYNCGECGTKMETKNSNYWGVTKAALSIIYFIH